MSYWLPLLFYFMLFHQPATSINDTNVNLVFPLVTYAEFQDCQKDICNISLLTRAGRYVLTNFDISNSTNSRVELLRVGDFIEPKLSDQKTYYEYGKELSYEEHAKELEAAIGNSKWPIDDPRFRFNSFMCEASNSFSFEFEPNQTESSICVTQDLARLCFGKEVSQYKCYNIRTPDILFVIPNVKGDFWVPITATLARQIEFYGDEKPKFIWILFDSIGRMFIMKSQLGDDRRDMILGVVSNTMYLSALLDPKSSPSKTTLQTPWLNPTIGQGNYLFDKPEIKSKLLSGVNDTAFIKAITSIYDGDKKGENGTKAALCFSSGYSPLNGIPITCLNDGKDHSSRAPKYELKDSKAKRVSILAYHLTNFNGDRVSHLFYQLVNKTDPGNFTGEEIGNYHYAFCRTKNSNFGPDNTINGQTEVTLDVFANETSNVDFNCKPRPIKWVPNDIIGVSKDKMCQRTVAFFDHMYSTHQPSEPISGSSVDQVGVLNKLNFYIQAAVSLNKNIYFFTHSNTLAIVDYSMDESCKLVFNFEKMIESTSQQFLLWHAYGIESSSKPTSDFLLDYREIEQFANNVNPPVTVNITESTTTTPAPEPAPEGGSSSKIVIILVSLVLGGLIIAGIVYMFCLRDGDLVVPVERRSRAVDSELGIKTVRSSHHELAAVKSSKAKTPSPKSPSGSKLKSPSVATKSKSKMQQQSPTAKSKLQSPAGKSKLQSPGAKSKLQSPVSKLKSPSSTSKPKSSSSANRGAKSSKARVVSVKGGGSMNRSPSRLSSASSKKAAAKSK